MDTSVWPSWTLVPGHHGHWYLAIMDTITQPSRTPVPGHQVINHKKKLIGIKSLLRLLVSNITIISAGLLVALLPKYFFIFLCDEADIQFKDYSVNLTFVQNVYSE